MEDRKLYRKKFQKSNELILKLSEERLRVGDTVTHFTAHLNPEHERECFYQIVGCALTAPEDDSEPDDRYINYLTDILIVYRPVYDYCITDFYLMPACDFFAEVDHEKYPWIKQKYAFEKGVVDSEEVIDYEYLEKESE